MRVVAAALRRIVNGTSGRSARRGVAVPRARPASERADEDGARERRDVGSTLVRLDSIPPAARAESERGRTVRAVSDTGATRSRAGLAVGRPRALSRDSAAKGPEVDGGGIELRFGVSLGRNSSGTICSSTASISSSSASASALRSASMTALSPTARKLSSVPLGRFGRPVRRRAPISNVWSAILVGVRSSSFASSTAIGAAAAGAGGAWREARSERGVRAGRVVGVYGVRAAAGVRVVEGVRTVDGGVSWKLSESRRVSGSVPVVKIVDFFRMSAFLSNRPTEGCGRSGVRRSLCGVIPSAEPGGVSWKLSESRSVSASGAFVKMVDFFSWTWWSKSETEGWGRRGVRRVSSWAIVRRAGGERRIVNGTLDTEPDGVTALLLLLASLVPLVALENEVLPGRARARPMLRRRSRFVSTATSRSSYVLSPIAATAKDASRREASGMLVRKGDDSRRRVPVARLEMVGDAGAGEASAGKHTGTAAMCGGDDWFLSSGSETAVAGRGTFPTSRWSHDRLRVRSTSMCRSQRLARISFLGDVRGDWEADPRERRWCSLSAKREGDEGEVESGERRVGSAVGEVLERVLNASDCERGRGEIERVDDSRSLLDTEVEVAGGWSTRVSVSETVFCSVDSAVDAS